MVLAKIQRRLARYLRRSWMKYALRGTGREDNHARLDVAYKVRDPWNMESPLERGRFEATNAQVEKIFGRVGSLLEIGCGEGHQSEYLARLADRLHGLDVSATAVERARERVPGAEFAAADIHAHPWGERRFDLVTACEVLYYMKDVRAAIDRMSAIGKACFVTCYSPTLQTLAAEFDRIPGLQRDWMFHGSTVWLVAWWRNDD